MGSALALMMWTLNLHSKPKVDKDLVRRKPLLSLGRAPSSSLQGREASLETFYRMNGSIVSVLLALWRGSFCFSCAAAAVLCKLQHAESLTTAGINMYECVHHAISVNPCQQAF